MAAASDGTPACRLSGLYTASTSAGRTPPTVAGRTPPTARLATVRCDRAKLSDGSAGMSSGDCVGGGGGGGGGGLVWQHTHASTHRDVVTHTHAERRTRVIVLCGGDTDRPLPVDDATAWR